MSSPRPRDLIAAERIRLLSLRSTYIFLACSLLIAVAAACLLSAKLNIRPVDRASYPSLNDAFNEDTGSLLMAIAACFGASAITGEYFSGLVRTTFTAIPARGRVMLAKALALAAVAGIAGAVATTPGRASRPGHDDLRCLVHPCQPADPRRASIRRHVPACPLRLAGDRVHARHRPRPAARHGRGITRAGDTA
jgi:hypothetical protein